MFSASNRRWIVGKETMTVNISLFTITTVAFLITIFTKNIYAGIVIAWLIHTIWFEFFGINAPVTSNFFISEYFWATLIWSFVGLLFTLFWANPPFLLGSWLKKEKRNNLSIPKIVFTSFIYFVFVAGAHWLAELEYGGNFGWRFLSLIPLFIIYPLFFWLLRNWVKIEGEAEEKILARKTAKEATFTFVLWLGILHILYTIAYCITVLVKTPTELITDSVNLFIIVAAIIAPIYAVFILIFGSAVLCKN